MDMYFLCRPTLPTCNSQRSFKIFSTTGKSSLHRKNDLHWSSGMTGASSEGVQRASIASMSQSDSKTGTSVLGRPSLDYDPIHDHTLRAQLPNIRISPLVPRKAGSKNAKASQDAPLADGLPAGLLHSTSQKRQRKVPAAQSHPFGNRVISDVEFLLILAKETDITIIKKFQSDANQLAAHRAETVKRFSQDRNLSPDELNAELDAARARNGVLQPPEGPVYSFWQSARE